MRERRVWGSESGRRNIKIRRTRGKGSGVERNPENLPGRIIKKKKGTRHKKKTAVSLGDKGENNWGKKKNRSLIVREEFNGKSTWGAYIADGKNAARGGDSDPWGCSATTPKPIVVLGEGEKR